MTFSTRPQTATAFAAAMIVAGLSTGCSSIGDALSGDKVDYRTTGAQTVKLDVPPDLSQLPGQARYSQINASTVSASSLGVNAPVAAQPVSIAINQAGVVKLERQGQTRWLVVGLPPEKLWPTVRDFWTEQGFDLQVERPDAGIIETNYLENRAKVGQDGAIRNALSRAMSFLYDSGLRDQYVTRIERTATGSEIYVAHRGLTEEYEDSRKDRTVWKGRPSDPQLEAQMLSKLLVKLGMPKDKAEATTLTAAAPQTASTASSYARLNADNTSLTLDTDFDTAWRRVGLALDRSGFTVESRDRKQGAYEIRLSQSDVEANRPGFWARLFGAKATGDGLSRFRVIVLPGQGKQTQVQVLSDTGKVVSDNPMALRVTKQLLDELV